MTNPSRKANRKYPSIPGVSGDVQSHTRALQAIKESIEIHERRVSNAYLDSFVSLRDLKDLGIIKIRGNQLVPGDSIGATSTSDGGGDGGGVTDHGDLSGLGDNDHPQYVRRALLTADGDIFIRSGGSVSRLPIGSEGQVLTVSSGGLPAWEDAAGATSGDEFLDSVVLLSGFDSSIEDESPYSRTMTANGDAASDTGESKFGAGSLLLDGSGDYAGVSSSPELHLLDNDFTIECFVWFDALSGSQNTILSHRSSSGGNRSWDFRYDATNNELEFLYSEDGTNVTILTSSWSPSVDTWYHVAVSRKGAALRMFVDGALLGSIHDIGGSTLYPSAVDLLLGNIVAGASAFLTGRLDEVRITVGVCRYIHNFSVPTSAFSRS